MENIMRRTRIAFRSLLAEALVRFRNVGCFLFGDDVTEVTAVRPAIAA